MTQPTPPSTSNDPFEINARWVLTPNRFPLANQTIRVEQGLITSMKPQQKEVNNTLHSFNVDFLTPGLINTHTHLDLSGGAPIPKSPDEPMSMWLLKVTESREATPGKTLAQLTEERCRQGSEKMLQTGVTCVNDITQTNAPFQALEQTGLRGVVSLEYFHPGYEQLYLDRLFTQYRDQFQPWQDKPSPHIRIGLSPHAPYNVSPKAWKAATKELNPSLIHAHVAECEDEREWLLGIKPNGIDGIHRRFLNTMFTPQPFPSHSEPSPHSPHSPHSPEWQYITQHHLLSLHSEHQTEGPETTPPPTVIAHGSLFTPHDLRALAQTQSVYLSHCPISNLFLHQTTLANVPPETLSRISLGTDSQLSHSTLDLRDDARFACQHHGWSAKTVFHMMTTNAAHTLHWEDTIGHIQTGYAADLVGWNTPINSPTKTRTEVRTETIQNNAEEENLYQTWLHPHCTPQYVWVNGKHVFTQQAAQEMEQEITHNVSKTFAARKGQSK